MTDNAGTGSTPNQPTLDPEVLLLAIFKGIDSLQTNDALEANSLAALKEQVANLSLNGEAFRIKGQQYPDGTVDCVLAGVPLRIAADGDVAVGAKQIERQKQRGQ
jgi:hypothetical protein